jgi:hypothetical protein
MKASPELAAGTNPMVDSKYNHEFRIGRLVSFLDENTRHCLTVPPGS